ncbi:uncharacterized protein [Polyergus mexicanus]|uniref:uncharacterized protein n=1 Tax=Polyergus mexicanus TaxID=615972 RepID=UPI0038B545B6
MALEVTNDNYEITWRLLKQRYENKRLIVQYLIQTLIDMPIINKESYTDLRNLTDSVSQCTQSLTKLGQPVGNWGTLLIHIILPKIDKGSRREWELKRSSIEEFPTLTEFLEFLISRSAFLESVSRANRNPQFSSASNDNRSNSRLHNHARNTAQAYVTANALSCSICSENHKTHECSMLRGMSPADRNSEIKRKRLCIKCLKAFHGRNCKAPSCKQYKGYHNTLLHIPSSEDSQISNVKDIRSKQESKSMSAVANHAQDQSSVGLILSSPSVAVNNCSTQKLLQVLLSTAVILVRDDYGALRECRALLDSGSQSNFITKRCSKLLGIKPETINTTVLGISSSAINAAQQITTTIKSRTSTFQGKLPSMIIRKITELANSNLKLSNQLEKFSKMEEITHESQCSKEENKCEAHFVSTFNRNHEGRFIVELPIKGDIQQLGESYHIAERRFKTLERKLEKQNDLKRQYHSFMREYLDLNHMQEVSFDERDYKPSYYIPHHSVIKEDSITTKVRVVFDASCKTSAGKSLNDMLMVGPTLQDDLFDIILRLRQHKYAMSADVSKMYRQINVAKNHLNLQRILWR